MDNLEGSTRHDGAFLPFATARLVLRAFVERDAVALASYRDRPEVARYQSWELPYTEAHSAALIAAMSGHDGPVAGDWVQIAVEHGDRLVGDVAVGLSSDGLTATIGYTLDTAAQGRGLATEAAGAVVDRLFGLCSIHRVVATLDPRNVASARVVKRLGFRFEGRSIQAELVRGEWLDEDRYAILGPERTAWLKRLIDTPLDAAPR